MAFARGLLLRLALSIEEYTEDICKKFLCSSHSMRVHGVAVQQERLSGRGHECYEPFPIPMYLLLNVLYGLLLPAFS